MSKVFNQANIYICLWCLYYMQGTLYEQGSIVSRTILLVLMIMSVLNVYLLNVKYKLPLYFKGLNILLGMFIVYGLALFVGGRYIPVGFSKISYLQEILISLLPIYSAYLYTRKGQITPRSLRLWIPIWFIVAITSFYFNKQLVIDSLVSDRVEITNNVAYSFVALMPVLVLYSKKPIIQFAFLLCCLVFVLLGMKRGAILVAFVIFCWFIFRIIKLINGNKRIYVSILIIAVVLIISAVVSSMLSTNEYFVIRLEQTMAGSTSGRESLYSVFWSNFISEQNFFRMMFGGGANYTLALAGNYAHQDWLEILTNQGLFGVAIYFYYFINFYFSWKFTRNNPIQYMAIGMLFIISFMTSLFSMGYGNMEIYATLTLGFFLAVSR